MTEKKKFKYIYGPVASWRLGSSLGIDPVSQKEKVCSFDCIYCQIGKTGILTDQRDVFVPVEAVVREISRLPQVHIDYITFSGRGEPTLARNLGQMIGAVKKIRNEKIAVITNASLLERKDVQEDLLPADFVLVKLDAASQDVFENINRPQETIAYAHVIEGIRMFRRNFRGKLALQSMFVRENEHCAKQIAALARWIKADEVQINTPLRPSGVKPLSESAIQVIKSFFTDVPCVSVYENSKPVVETLSDEDTLKRRGKI